MCRHAAALRIDVGRKPDWSAGHERIDELVLGLELRERLAPDIDSSIERARLHDDLRALERELGSGVLPTVAVRGAIAYLVGDQDTVSGQALRHLEGANRVLSSCGFESERGPDNESIVFATPAAIRERFACDELDGGDLARRLKQVSDQELWQAIGLTEAFWVETDRAFAQIVAAAESRASVRGQHSTYGS